MTKQPEAEVPEPRDFKTNLLSLFGYIIGVSYPVLALSTGVRALYQLLLKEGVTNYLGPTLSLVAAILYLIATIGFFRRTPRWWRISVTALSLETLLTLVVGTLSFILPEVIGGTVWRHFGQDYGFVPLIQPLIGLAWLWWMPTRQAYGIVSHEQSLPEI
jgi:hypothetical protein